MDKEKRQITLTPAQIGEYIDFKLKCGDATPEECAAALAYEQRIVQCKDCRHYYYSEEAGGSVCVNNDSDWVADYPPSDCSCQHCERREG